MKKNTRTYLLKCLARKNYDKISLAQNLILHETT